MARELPEVITVRAYMEDEAFDDAAVIIRLPTTKNAVALFARTDGDGHVTISRDELVSLIDATITTGLMDYGEMLGEIHVAVGDRDDVERLRAGYDTWRGSYPYPVDFLEWLDALQPRLGDLAGSPLRAEAVAVGGSFTVVGSSRRTST